MSLFVCFFSEITCAVYLISLHHDDRVINMSLAVMGIVNQPLWDWFVTFALNCFSAALPSHYKQALSTFTTSTHIALTMLSTLIIHHGISCVIYLFNCISVHVLKLACVTLPSHSKWFLHLLSECHCCLTAK